MLGRCKLRVTIRVCVVFVLTCLLIVSKNVNLNNVRKCQFEHDLFINHASTHNPFKLIYWINNWESRDDKIPHYPINLQGPALNGAGKIWSERIRVINRFKVYPVTDYEMGTGFGVFDRILHLPAPFYYLLLLNLRYYTWCFTMLLCIKF